MNNKKENTLLIILIAIGLCIITLISISEIKNKNKINQQINNINNVDAKQKEDMIENSKGESKEESVNKENDNLDNNIENEKKEETIRLSNNDKIIIGKFENIETSTDKLLAEKDDETVGDKLKGIFITIVDFLFYDTEIDGITFAELTENGKQEVLKIANAIDEKIERKFPGYKETISEKTKNAFEKASELIKKGADNIKEFSREKLGEENYNLIISAKEELVKYTKNAFEIIGDIGSELFNKASSSIKDWYEQFRDN